MNLSDCVALATFAHRNQYDKAGEPYINHPLRVLESVKAQGAQSYVQMAAVLHDVTEDTPFTPQMLIDLGVPEAAVEIVKLVDRDYSEHDCIIHDDYWHGVTAPKSDPDWLKRKDEYYYQQIRQHKGALQVKLADIIDNLQPRRLSYLPLETQTRLKKKYAKAIELLTGD